MFFIYRAVELPTSSLKPFLNIASINKPATLRVDDFQLPAVFDENGLEFFSIFIDKEHDPITLIVRRKK